LGGRPGRAQRPPLPRSADLADPILADAAEAVLAEVAERHATFSRMNLLAETHRPGYTYWYLSGAPELLALAAARLEKCRGLRP
jgi:hypothetical protein